MMSVDQFRGLLHGGGRVHDRGEWTAASTVVDRAVRLDRDSRRSLPSAPCGIWISTDSHRTALLAALSWSGRHACFLVDLHMTEGEAARQAASFRPDLLIVSDPAAAVAKWAAANGIGVARLGEDGDFIAPAGVPASSASAGIGFYTSGSTGAPTPVLHSIGAVASAAAMVASRLGLSGEDTALAASPVHHTLGFVTTLLAPLATGGEAVVIRPRVAGSLSGSTARERVSWCASTPAVLSLLDRTCGHLGLRLPRLRLVRSSGAPLKERAARSLREGFGVPLVNAYAMTQAPGEICSQDVGSTPKRLDSVGVPTGAEVRIASGSDLPDGAGEIRVRGPNVAGALRAADGWLSTRDIGKWCDGELVITGRSDDLLNCGGEKVVPQEIELVAETHPGIKEAFVFPIPAGDYGEKVGLAVDVADGAALEKADLSRFLGEHLSPHKIPALITPLPSSAYGSRGKINRRTFHTRVPRSGNANAS